MIRPEEIIATARRDGVRPQEVEKEYLQYAFLHSLAGSPDGLVFRGGTMLRIAHAHPRYSEDLDFVRLHSVEEAEAAVDEALLDLRDWGLKEKHDEPTRSDKGTLIWTVEFRGPLYRRTNRVNRIKVELGSTNDVGLDAENSIVGPRFADIPSFVIATQNRLETTAEKVRALAERDFARDLYDIAHLLRLGLQAPRELVERKLGWKAGDSRRALQPHSEMDYNRELETWVPAASRLPWRDAWRLAWPYLQELRCISLPATGI